MVAERVWLGLVFCLGTFDVAAAAPAACGDCDARGDGTTILDALVGAQAAAAILVPVDPMACDVDATTTIAILDALAMARFVAGLPVTLNCVPSGAPQPVIAAYVESLRFGYADQISDLDMTAVDIVIHGFITPDTSGGLVENPNFTDFRTWPWATPPDVPLPQAVHAAGKKIVMSIGGATVPGSVFATIAANPAVRATFVANAVAHMQTIGYDGIDIDYEFPTSVAEGADFTLLMQELYAATKAADPSALVIFGVGPGNYIGFAQWTALASVCDYAFFFGYDWRNPALGPMANPGVPFVSASGHVFEASVRGAVGFALDAGFPAERMILGLPFYSSSNTSWDSSAHAAWVAGAPWSLHPSYLEVQIAGAWWTPPEGIAAKLAAFMDPATSQLPASATLGGVGFWEWGHEDPAYPDLSTAIVAWLVAHGLR